MKLNLIISESNRMSEMVNDILDYSQFSAGYSSLKKEWCDLRDIVTAELTRCRQAAAEHGITLTLLVTEETSDRRSSASAADVQSSRPFFFEVDALKMSQVMRNLLNNAINHTPENQEIRICLTPQPAARFRSLPAHRFRLAIQLPSPATHRQKQPFPFPAALSRSSIPVIRFPKRTVLSSGSATSAASTRTGAGSGPASDFPLSARS